MSTGTGSATNAGHFWFVPICVRQARKCPAALECPAAPPGPTAPGSPSGFPKLCPAPIPAPVSAPSRLWGCRGLTPRAAGRGAISEPSVLRNGAGTLSGPSPALPSAPLPAPPSPAGSVMSPGPGGWSAVSAGTAPARPLLCPPPAPDRHGRSGPGTGFPGLTPDPGQDPDGIPGQGALGTGSVPLEESGAGGIFPGQHGPNRDSTDLPGKAAQRLRS